MARYYKGISFPFRFDSSGATAMTELTPDDLSLIRESLYQIWFTRKGERVMEPEFGTDLNFNFENIDDETEMAIMMHEMQKAAEEHEPRVVIRDISYEQHAEIETAIVFTIKLTVVKFNVDTEVTVVYDGS